MRIWGKMLAVAVAPLMLSGCLWGPGKFTSDLTLNKAGTFVLDYRGEVVLQGVDDKAPPEPWRADLAVCRKDGTAKVDTDLVSVSLEAPAKADGDATDEEAEKRPCTASEIAGLKAEYEKKAAEKLAEQRQEADNTAKMFGLPSTDDEANRRFAANLMKYQGWRSVVYKGKGVFDVDYHVEGRLTQDYVFPLMPETNVIIPFITLRRRTDGSVMVRAPALTGGSGPFGARANMLNLPDKDNGPVSRAEGRFTITTDGEILTNNSEDGPMTGPAGRQVHWDVGPGSDRIPETLVKL